jgi:hypothetical protein
MRVLKLVVLLSLFITNTYGQKPVEPKPRAGNPVFKGWYADPEGTIFNNKYWIYPTYSRCLREAGFPRLLFFTRSYQLEKTRSHH